MQLDANTIGIGSRVKAKARPVRVYRKQVRRIRGPGELAPPAAAYLGEEVAATRDSISRQLGLMDEEERKARAKGEGRGAHHACMRARVNEGRAHTRAFMGGVWAYPGYDARCIPGTCALPSRYKGAL